MAFRCFGSPFRRKGAASIEQNTSDGATTNDRISPGNSKSDFGVPEEGAARNLSHEPCDTATRLDPSSTRNEAAAEASSSTGAPSRRVTSESTANETGQEGIVEGTGPDGRKRKVTQFVQATVKRSVELEELSEDLKSKAAWAQDFATALPIDFQKLQSRTLDAAIRAVGAIADVGEALPWVGAAFKLLKVVQGIVKDGMLLDANLEKLRQVASDTESKLLRTKDVHEDLEPEVRKLAEALYKAAVVVTAFNQNTSTWRSWFERKFAPGAKNDLVIQLAEDIRTCWNELADMSSVKGLMATNSNWAKLEYLLSPVSAVCSKPNVGELKANLAKSLYGDDSWKKRLESVILDILKPGTQRVTFYGRSGSGMSTFCEQVRGDERVLEQFKGWKNVYYLKGIGRAVEGPKIDENVDNHCREMQRQLFERLEQECGRRASAEGERFPTDPWDRKKLLNDHLGGFTGRTILLILDGVVDDKELEAFDLTTFKTGSSCLLIGRKLVQGARSVGTGEQLHLDLEAAKLMLLSTAKLQKDSSKERLGGVADEIVRSLDPCLPAEVEETGRRLQGTIDETVWRGQLRRIQNRRAREDGFREGFASLLSQPNAKRLQTLFLLVAVLPEVADPLAADAPSFLHAWAAAWDIELEDAQTDVDELKRQGLLFQAGKRLSATFLPEADASEDEMIDTGEDELNDEDEGEGAIERGETESSGACDGSTGGELNASLQDGDPDDVGRGPPPLGRVNFSHEKLQLQINDGKGGPDALVLLDTGYNKARGAATSWLRAFMREWEVRKAAELRAEWVFLKDLAGAKDIEALKRLLDKCVNARAVSLAGQLEELPAEVKKLREIVFFRYHGNGLSKGLPPQVGKWRHLSAFHLEQAKLRELCEEAKQWAELEVLQLRNCEKLAALPTAAVGAWQHLRTLILSGCSSLTRLPCEVGTFTNVQTVDLSRCKALVELPSEVGAWGGSLTSVRLTSCSSLTGLPESVERWSGLKTISLKGATSLMRLPEGCRGWVNVRRVNLGKCKALEGLPEGVSMWLNLRSMELSGCSPHVTSLPEGITAWAEATSIRIGCSGVVDLPPLTGTQWLQLETLDLSECNKLQALPSGLGSLRHLEELNLEGCSELQILPTDLCQLELSTLRLDRCEKLDMTEDAVYDLFRGSEETLYWLFNDGCPAVEGALKLPLLAEVAAFFRRRLGSVRARQAESLKELGQLTGPATSQDQSNPLLESHFEGRHVIVHSAVSLAIVWKDSEYWRPEPDPKALFETAMKVYGVCWFDVHGGLRTAVQQGRAYTAAWRICADYNREASDWKVQSGELTFVTTVKAPDAEPAEFRVKADLDTLLHGAQYPEEGYFELEVATFGVNAEGAVKDFASLGQAEGGVNGPDKELEITFEIVNHDGTRKFGFGLDCIMLRHTLPAELRILSRRKAEYDTVMGLVEEAKNAADFSPEAFWRERLVAALNPCLVNVRCDQCDEEYPSGGFWRQCRSYAASTGSKFQTNFCESCFSEQDPKRWLKVKSHMRPHEHEMIFMPSDTRTSWSPPPNDAPSWEATEWYGESVWDLNWMQAKACTSKCRERRLQASGPP